MDFPSPPRSGHKFINLHFNFMYSMQNIDIYLFCRIIFMDSSVREAVRIFAPGGAPQGPGQEGGLEQVGDDVDGVVEAEEAPGGGSLAGGGEIEGAPSALDTGTEPEGVGQNDSQEDASQGELNGAPLAPGPDEYEENQDAEGELGHVPAPEYFPVHLAGGVAEGSFALLIRNGLKAFR